MLALDPVPIQNYRTLQRANFIVAAGLRVYSERQKTFIASSLHTTINSWFIVKTLFFYSPERIKCVEEVYNSDICITRCETQLSLSSQINFHSSYISFFITFIIFIFIIIILSLLLSSLLFWGLLLLSLIILLLSLSKLSFLLLFTLSYQMLLKNVTVNIDYTCTVPSEHKICSSAFLPSV